MIVAPQTPEEDRRLAALYQYELLDTPSEDLFDAFTTLAATICDAPISLISLIDSDRQWFKSRFGLAARETPRDVAFCAHAILEDGIFEINDAQDDQRFFDNPLVTGEPLVRFYAGVPLRTSDGFALGTLCVLDRVPRTLTDEQRTSLAALAEALVEQFEARRALLRLFDSSQTELYHVDLKTRRIVFASEAARRNLGYSADELRAVPLETLLPALATDGRLEERIAELRAEPGHRVTMRARARRHDGTTYPIELRIELIPTRRNEVVLVVATDLTEREQTAERITLLSAAIEAARDPILIARFGATPQDSPIVLYANEAYVRTKGVSVEEVVNQPIDRYLGAKTDRTELIQMRADVMAGNAGKAEYETYRADGSSYYVQSSARPLLDEGGQVYAYVVVQRDVTETVLRGAELTLQNERLTALTSIARTLFAALDPDALVGALIAGVRHLLDGVPTLYAARDDGAFVATYNLLPTSGAVGDDFITLATVSDICVLDHTGARAAVRIAGENDVTAFVLDVRREEAFAQADVFALGLLAQYVAVAVRNVVLYRELSARRDAVVELNQLKNDLIAMLAHDFRGPLTTIVGFADVLGEEENLTDEAREYLGMISSSAMRLAALASDTLALSQLERNELSLTIEPVDIGALVRDVARVFSVTRPIDVRVGAGPHVVQGDAGRLRQVIENLVGNAIKYSPGGEPVDIVVRNREDAIELAVRDRGIGVPAADRARLFGRFARASNARALGIGGTGFGLYLARTIVELHGGRIDVSSTEGSGSTFRVTLPLGASPAV
jgi:PAS domain S-box-containing protein